MNENSLVKFQDLLRTLFQFDCVGLDFGIYRILNYKRKRVAIVWRSVVGARGQ